MRRFSVFLFLILLVAGCEIDLDLRTQRTKVTKTRVDFPENQYPPPVVWIEAKNTSKDTIKTVYYRANYVSKSGHYRWIRVIRCDFSRLNPERVGFTRCNFIEPRPNSETKVDSDTLKVVEIAFR